MAIDPSIPLQVKPISPSQSFRAGQEAVRQRQQQEQAMAMQQKQAEFQQRQQEFVEQQQKLQQAGQILGAINGPQDYALALPQLQQLGFDEEDGIGPMYNPMAVNFARNRLKTIDQKFKEQELALRQQDLEFRREQETRLKNQPRSINEVELALRAVQGDRDAAAAMGVLNPPDKTTTPGGLQGELAGLLQIPEANRSEQQKARISALREAMTTVANTYQEGAADRAGSFVAETDPQGNILGYYNPKTGEKKPAAFGGRKSAQSFEERRAATNARSGLRAITDMRNMLLDKNILAQVAVPGSLGARKFSAARAEAIDVLTRLRTGAALNEDEWRFYKDQKVPTLLDLSDPTTVEYKLKALDELFNDLATGGVGNTGAPTSRDVPKPKNDPLGIF